LTKKSTAQFGTKKNSNTTPYSKNFNNNSSAMGSANVVTEYLNDYELSPRPATGNAKVP